MTSVTFFVGNWQSSCYSCRRPSRGVFHSEFLLVRNYLILSISNMTGHRCGIILNSLTEEYYHATQNDSSTMFVVKHKTYATYGAMPIKLPKDLCHEVNKYLMRRTALMDPSNDIYLFPRSGGSRMMSNDVCRGIQEITGIEELTATRIRMLRAMKVSVFCKRLFSNTFVMYYTYNNDMKSIY
jgi:hypothetical protein